MGGVTNAHNVLGEVRLDWVGLDWMDAIGLGVELDGAVVR